MMLPLPSELLPKIADQLQTYLTTHNIQNPVYVGIRTGGVWVATQLLAEMNKQDETLGILDVSFYRDDFTQKGLNPQVSPSALPFEIDNQHVVLIDDVLMSGRTIRAAMNELFDYGRPASITLVCLLDLNARELPIRPDVVGEVLSLPENQRVKVQGPTPLTLELKTLAC